MCKKFRTQNLNERKEFLRFEGFDELNSNLINLEGLKEALNINPSFSLNTCSVDVQP